MTPDADICTRCTLPECDTKNSGCALRRTYNLVRSRQSRGLPVSEAETAIANVFAKENWIDWRADKLEARP